MNVLLVYNENNKAASQAAPQISTWLTGLGITCQTAADHRRDHELVLADVSLALSLGGDGTLLRAARLVGPHDIPLLGLSYGNLGFLTGAHANETMVAIERALSGELHETRRSMLEAQVLSAPLAAVSYLPNYGAYCPPNQMCTHRFVGLNDVAVDRGARPRMLEYTLAINDVNLAHHRGDGLVISTASGSTGYALSAGGPIMAPEIKGLLAVPLAAHSLASRPILVGSSDVIEVKFHHGRPADTKLYVDGVEPLANHLIFQVQVSRAAHEVRLLSVRSEDFYTKVASTFFGMKSQSVSHDITGRLDGGSSVVERNASAQPSTPLPAHSQDTMGQPFVMPSDGDTCHALCDTDSRAVHQAVCEDSAYREVCREEIPVQGDRTASQLLNEVIQGKDVSD